jgi:peptide/nickel transport system substrate-binding protein
LAPRLVVVLAIVAVGIGGTSAGASTRSARPVTGGTFTFLKGAEQNVGWDPINLLGVPFNGEVPGSFAIYDWLLYEDPVTLKLVPRLAESLTTSDGGKTWTLKLRPNVKFSDGTALDAAAVQFNWARIADPVNKASSAVVAQQIQTMDVVDPLTLRVILKAADPNFNRRVAYGLYAIASPTALKSEGADFGTHPVGAGPFILKEWIRDSQQTYVRNPNYWEKGRPYLDSVVVKIVRDDIQKWNTVQTGGANGLIVFNTPQGHEWAATPGFQHTYMSAAGGGWGLNFNNSKPPFNDVRLRQAVAMAIDRVAFNKATRDKSWLVNTLEAPGSPYYNPKLKLPAYDLAGAQKLIDQIVADQGGKPISVTMQVFDVPYILNDAQVIQASLQKLKNLEVKLEVLSTTTLTARFLSGDYQFFVSSIRWTDPTIGMVDAYQSTGSTNARFLRYKSSEADAAAGKLASATTTAEKTAAHDDLARIVLRDVPNLALTQFQSIQVYDKTVHNYNNFFDAIPLLDQVWLSKAK